MSLIFGGSEKELIDILLKGINEKIETLSMEGKTIAYVSKVIDGDSMKLVVVCNDGKCRIISCRLNGVDTPELRDHNEDIKKLAYKAKEFVSSIILHKFVHVTIGKADKFGRYLVDIYIKTDKLNSLAQILIDRRMAYEYHGKTKNKQMKLDKDGYLAI